MVSYTFNHPNIEIALRAKNRTDQPFFTNVLTAIRGSVR